MRDKWFLYRPVFAGKLTLSELYNVVTIRDVLELNALLDMEDDIKKYQHEEQQRNIRSKR